MRLLRPVIYLVTLAMSLSGMLLAAQSEEEEEFSLSVGGSVDLVSRYIWRGFDITDDRPVVQPGFTLAHNSSGLWLNVWSSQSIAARDLTRDADELDLTFGFDHDLNDHIAISLGSISYFYPRLSTNEDFTSEVYGGLTLTGLPLSPNLSYYHDFKLGDGGYWAVGGAHSFRDLTLSMDFGFNDGQYTEKSGFLDAVFGASYDIALGSGGYLTPYVRIAIIDDEARNPDNSEAWFGVAFGWER